jgi:hypothetical protein
MVNQWMLIKIKVSTESLLSFRLQKLHLKKTWIIQNWLWLWRRLVVEVEEIDCLEIHPNIPYDKTGCFSND